MADILEALARAIFGIILECVLQGTGHIILRLFFGPADRDSNSEVLVGLLFWVGMVALIITIAICW